MIERQNALPRGGGMAGLAAAPQLSFVRVLAGVAAGAITRRSPVFMRRAVAACAGDTAMRPGQRIFRQSMIESGAVQLDHVETAPLVLGMAALACSVPGRGKFPVKVRALRDVGPDAFMTIGTFGILRAFAE